jgi:hypothetical protein
MISIIISSAVLIIVGFIANMLCFSFRLRSSWLKEDLRDMQKEHNERLERLQEASARLRTDVNKLTSRMTGVEIELHQLGVKSDLDYGREDP